MTINKLVVSASEAGDIDDASQPVIASTAWVDTPHSIEAHQHLRGQFIYASSGSIKITTEGPTFVVPSQFAAWIPPAMPHSVVADTPVDYCSLFLHKTVAIMLPGYSVLLHLTPLVKELTRTVACDDLSPIDGALERHYAVLLDQLRLLRPAPLALPIPVSPRFTKMIAYLLENPGDQRDLEAWANEISMSSRTLSRHFRQETSMSFKQWLQHLRVMKAIEMLEAGASVTTIAYELGYQQPSAFIVMFRKITGKTPTEFAFNMAS